MSDWQPIETAMTDAPHRFHDVQGRSVRYIDDVLVYGPCWKPVPGIHADSPHDSNGPEHWSGESDVWLASTYEDAPAWVATQNNGDCFTDDYIQPTHWMPLPPPPLTD